MTRQAKAIFDEPRGGFALCSEEAKPMKLSKGNFTSFFSWLVDF
jgi:hypothetical protein